MRPFRLLFLIFLIVPLIEIYLLLIVGSFIGPLPTVALVLFTAVLGAWLLRIEGLATWFRLQQCLAQGRIPALEIVEGPILLVGGALLLTPGFFTDFLGLLCLLPATRRRLARYVLNRWLVWQVRGACAEKEPRTIEGEFERRG
ncbi:MAG: FxsA family protein [Methylohalobius sp.]|nr:FxsA family protein [Methylohalobius sp.]